MPASITVACVGNLHILGALARGRSDASRHCLLQINNVWVKVPFPHRYLLNDPFRKNKTYHPLRPHYGLSSQGSGLCMVCTLCNPVRPVLVIVQIENTFFLVNIGNVKRWFFAASISLIQPFTQGVQGIVMGFTLEIVLWEYCGWSRKPNTVV